MPKYLLKPSFIPPFMLGMVLACTTFAQNAKAPTSAVPTTQNLDATVDRLAERIKADPRNPLQIDKQKLNEIASKMPDGELKYKLLDYGNRLGVDENLGIRQVYWDLKAALGQNEATAKLTSYAETAQSLDILFNKSGLVAKALRGDIKDIHSTTFMSDPQFVSSLAQVTGSYDKALGMAAGAGMAVELVNIFKESKKFRDEFAKYSELSEMMMHSEADENLARALIDAIVTNDHNTPTAIYRYELDNGSTFALEGKNMVWVNKERNAKLDGGKVAIKTDHNSRTHPHFPAKLPVVSENESHIFLVDNVYDAKDFKPYLSGKIKTKEYFPMGKTKMDNENLYLWAWGPPGYYGKYQVPFSTYKQERIVPAEIRPPKGITFLIDNKEHPWKTFGVDLLMDLHFDHIPKVTLSSYQTSSKELSGQPDDNKRLDAYYTGNIVILSDGTGQKVYKNQITGFDIDANSTLFMVSPNGAIFKLDGKTIGSVRDLEGKIQEGLAQKPLVAAYDFKEETLIPLFASSQFQHPFFKHPTLKLTPDEKWLVYVIKDKLFIINPQNLSEVKEYQLAYKPVSTYFGKENGGYTLHLLGENEFRMSVTKKYDINTLVNDYKKPAVASKPTNSGAQQKATGSSSVSDEIRKLKKLLDEGLITQEEYEKGKKKILGN